MTSAAASEPLQLETDDGLRLEGVVDIPDAHRATLVLCHPHPKMGGTMNAPLLEVLRDAIVERRWAVIRFNFRGIGASQGESSTGLAELADARAAISEARERWPSLPTGITGWSFGGAVAVRAALDDPSLAACIGIAPAVKGKPDVTVGLPDANEAALTVPALFVVGENDTHVSPDDAQEWAGAQGFAVKRLPGANHFFWGKYEDLADEVTGFLDEVLENRPEN